MSENTVPEAGTDRPVVVQVSMAELVAAFREVAAELSKRYLSNRCAG